MFSTLTTSMRPICRVDATWVPPSAWAERVEQRANEFAARTDRPKDAKGVALTPLDRRFEGDAKDRTGGGVGQSPVGRLLAGQGPSGEDEL